MAKIKGKCFYCNSQKIKHPSRTSFKSRLYFVATAWFSPDTPKKSIEIASWISCCKCNRKYQPIKCGKQMLQKIIPSLNPTHHAMQTFKTIFPSNGFSDWSKHILNLVQPERDTIHIIFRLCKIRAYMDCRKIKGRFIIVSVDQL